MKKVVSVFALTSLLLAFFSCYSLAYNDYAEEINYFDDGSYIIVISNEISYSPLSKNLMSNSSKTKSITAKHYDSNDSLLWSATLTATFTYNGTTSSCTSVSKSHTVYNSSWRLTESSCLKSGNTATGNFTFKHYVLGIPIQTINQTMSMTCDKNGNIT